MPVHNALLIHVFYGHPEAKYRETFNWKEISIP